MEVLAESDHLGGVGNLAPPGRVRFWDVTKTGDLRKVTYQEVVGSVSGMSPKQGIPQK